MAWPARQSRWLGYPAKKKTGRFSCALYPSETRMLCSQRSFSAQGLIEPTPGGTRSPDMCNGMLCPKPRAGMNSRAVRGAPDDEERVAGTSPSILDERKLPTCPVRALSVHHEGRSLSLPLRSALQSPESSSKDRVGDRRGKGRERVRHGVRSNRTEADVRGSWPCRIPAGWSRTGRLRRAPTAESQGPRITGGRGGEKR